MNTTFISLVSGALLAVAVPAAQAATVSYSFSVAVDSGGLAGQTFIGNFSFDDAQVPGTGIGGEDLFALSSFNFGFGGSLSLTDLNYGDAAFLGGQFLGLDAGGATFAFLPANGPFAASFAYDLGRGVAGNGSVTYTPRVDTVPEPATLWLALGLLGGLAGVRRVTARR
jgi:hypothetical protein